MTKELIKVSIDRKVAVATMDNPPANALSPALRDEFMDKLKMLAEKRRCVGGDYHGARGRSFSRPAPTSRRYWNLDRGKRSGPGSGHPGRFTAALPQCRKARDRGHQRHVLRRRAAKWHWPATYG